MSASTAHTPTRRASLPALIAGFASIYLIWGSTYLAIKFVVDTLPPFLTAGARFLTAGAVLWFIAQLNHSRSADSRSAAAPPRPTFSQFRHAALAGIFMLTGGNGLVCWSQQYVDSGVAALLVGTVPIWMVVLEWVIYRGPRPGPAVWLGLALGFCGIAILAGLRTGASTTFRWGIAALMLATVFWSIGSLRSRRVDQGPSLLQATAMQMLAGGAALLLVGTLIGEWPALDPASFTPRALLALLYLIIVGSLIGFTSYVWLLQVASPAAVSTYAYVNPVVAVFLGWWLADESVSAWTLLAGAMVVGAVILMTFRGGQQSPPRTIPTDPTRAEQRPGMAMPGRCLNR